MGDTHASLRDDMLEFVGEEVAVGPCPDFIAADGPTMISASKGGIEQETRRIRKRDVSSRIATKRDETSLPPYVWPGLCAPCALGSLEGGIG